VGHPVIIDARLSEFKNIFEMRQQETDSKIQATIG
jgi:hypothetical protein